MKFPKTELMVVSCMAFVSSIASGNEVLKLLEGEDSLPKLEVEVEGEPANKETKKAKAGKVFDTDRISRDWLWERRETVRDERSVLYNSDANPFIQKAAIDAYWNWGYENGKVNRASSDDTNFNIGRTRSLRVGGLIKALYSVDIEGQALFDSDFRYQGIETLQLRGHLTPNTHLSLGKSRVPFSYNNTLDPTRRRITKLPALTAQLAPANTLGALLEGTLNGEDGAFSWGVGWYSGDVDRNLPDLKQDGFLLAKMGYFVPSAITEEKEDPLSYQNYQHWYLDYIYNLDAENSSSIRSDYRHLLSIGFEMRIDRTDLALNFLLATGGGADSVWGVNAEAGYWIVEDSIRAVGRFQYASSNGDDALVVGYGPASIESNTGLPFQYSTEETGDNFSSIYLGSDFHIYGDNAVMSAGLEYQVLTKSNFLTDQDIESLSFLWNMRFAL